MDAHVAVVEETVIKTRWTFIILKGLSKDYGGTCILLISSDYAVRLVYSIEKLTFPFGLQQS